MEFYEGNSKKKKNELSQTYIEFDGCISNVKSEKRNFMGRQPDEVEIFYESTWETIKCNTAF